MRTLAIATLFATWALSSAAATLNIELPPGDYMLVPVAPYTVVTVQSVPIDPPAPIDTDGDGITDDIDQCSTVVGVPPDGCPLPPVDPPVTDAGWSVAIPGESFTAAAPTDAELVAFSAGGPTIRGVVGPSSVFSKWNGAAFDPETGRIYAHGGGHFDYAGNEVYVADIDAGTWERLTDPSPYIGEVIATDANGVDYHAPLVGPISSHTYAGTVWNPDTQSIVVGGYSATATFSGIAIPYPPSDGVHEFNPATLTWTTTPGMRQSMGAAVYVPTTQRVYVATGYTQVVRAPDGTWSKGNGFNPKLTQAVLTYDATRDRVWSVRGASLIKWTPTNTGLIVEETIVAPVQVTDLLPGATGLAERQGKIWLYGGNGVVVYDPDMQTWKQATVGDTVPATGYVFNKFWYWPSRDVFVLAANGGVVWLLNPNGLTLSLIDLQANKAEVNGEQYAVIQDAIDAARPGDTVTILPGTYDTGIRVATDDLTIKAAGVVIDGGIYGGKAWAVQTARNLTIDGIEAKNLAVADGNASLIRMEPSASGLTLRNVYVHDSQGGCCVTGNTATGEVLIEGSRFERVGHGGQAHGIYAGRNISKVIVRDSEFIGGHGGGHLIKSRAAYTEIVNTHIDGLDGNNSREIDIPEAGMLILDNVTVRKGPNAENNDSIGYALETWRPWHTDQRIEIRNSAFVDESGRANYRLLHVGTAANPQAPAPAITYESVTLNGVTVEG